MSHARVRARLSAYLEGDLPSRQRREVASHLAGCEACAGELVELRRTVDLLRGLERPEPPPGLVAGVLARVASPGSRPPLHVLRTWLERALSASWAAPVGAAALGLLAFSFVQTIDASMTEGRPVAQALGPGLPRLAAVSPPTPHVPGLPREHLASAGSAASPRVGQSTLPSMASCIPGRPGGEPSDAPGCAAWYAWFVGLALEDAPGFLDEMERLPSAHRDPWLEQVSAFAARSGAAPMVGSRLRSTPDPRASPLAQRFERRARAPIQTVDFAR